MKKLRLTVAAAVAAVILTAVPALSASATDTAVDPQISAALEAVPGGEVVDYYTAYWPEEEMTLTVPGTSAHDASARSAIGTCPNGSVCVFSASGLGGSRLSWTSCTVHSTAALGVPVRSIADARSTGYLQARNGTTVVATAYAQSWNDVSPASTNVRCVL